MLRGLAQLNFFADDMAAARRWYSELLGMEPYFERFGPDGSLAYMEFRVGDYQHEFGLIHRSYAPHPATDGPAGAVANWHVDDVDAALERLRSMGATEHEPRIDRGDSGWVTASVVDPFGNILGITYNPHFVEVRRAWAPASRPRSGRTSRPSHRRPAAEPPDRSRRRRPAVAGPASAQAVGEGASTIVEGGTDISHSHRDYRDSS